jgi:hypothetical protein
MSDEPTITTATSRSAFLWIGGVMIVVIVATATAFLFVLLFGGDRDEPLPTSGSTIAVAVRELALRSAPDGATAIVARFDTGDTIEILGRDQTGNWLIVHPEGNSSTTGWIRADGIDPPPSLDQIPITTALIVPATTASASRPPGSDLTADPTFTPDLPDLTIEAVFARDNRLTVVISNIGVVDANGTIFISVDGRTPITADVKPGEPLHPDDQLEIRIDTEYVQRRATVRVAVSTNPQIDEESLDNNQLETVVTPDLPNDLVLASVTLQGPDGSLLITIRNDSPIPLTGNVTISARERSSDLTQLANAHPFLALTPGESHEVNFPDVIDVELDNIEVLITTAAINDADHTNDVFPRR